MTERATVLLLALRIFVPVLSGRTTIVLPAVLHAVTFTQILSATNEMEKGSANVSHVHEFCAHLE